MLRSSQALLLRRLSPSPLQLLWRVLWAMLLGSTWIYLDLLGGTCNAREDNTYNEPSSCQVGPGHCQWLKGHVSDAFYISRLLMVRRQCPRIPGGESLCGPEDQRLPDSAELLWPRGSGRAHPIPGLCNSTQSAKFSAFKEFHKWNSEPLLLDLLECHKWKMCIAEPAACCFLGVFS